MKIGIWLGSDDPAQLGGGVSYTSKLINLIDEHEFDPELDLVFITLNKNVRQRKKVMYLSCIPNFLYLAVSFSSKLSMYLKKIDFYLLKRKYASKQLEEAGVKYIYYIRQSQIPFPNIPFVATNWDIGHMSTYSFPELISNGQFEKREKMYRQILPKALLVFCESEAGKKELLTYTRVGQHKIRIVPLFAGDVTKINPTEEFAASTLSNFGIEKYKYFFYPAQFWAHKNHYNLLRAFAEFKKNNNVYKLVLCGKDWGNKEYVCNLIDEFGLKNSVVILRFLSNEELAVLYRSATALVMASHFGPTNMPPIEAMEMGCPVMCSDIAGHKEIMQNAASYFNSYDYHSICNSFNDIVLRREEFVSKVLFQRENTPFTGCEAIKRIEKFLLEAVNIRSNWGNKNEIWY